MNFNRGFHYKLSILVVLPLFLEAPISIDTFKKEGGPQFCVLAASALVASAVLLVLGVKCW